MTKTELARRSGVSVSYLSDLTTVGKANPSLKIMASIAEIIDVPLPRLLEQNPVTLPEGYEHVSVVLPKHQAFIVKKWVKVARANNISEKSGGGGGSYCYIVFFCYYLNLLQIKLHA